MYQKPQGASCEEVVHLQLIEIDVTLTNPHPLLRKGPANKKSIFAIWQLGSSRWVQITPAGCGNDLPTRQASFCELSKITQNQEV